MNSEAPQRATEQLAPYSQPACCADAPLLCAAKGEQAGYLRLIIGRSSHQLRSYRLGKSRLIPDVPDIGNARTLRLCGEPLPCRQMSGLMSPSLP